MSMLSFIFNTKYSKYPMFLQYVDYTHRVDGNDYLEAKRILEEGDILLRGHDNYLSRFIIPGEYSHSGIYIGGEWVIHSTVEKGVHKATLVDFMRCDRFIALRPNFGRTDIRTAAYKYIGKNYDNELEDADDEYYCHEFVAAVLNKCGFGIEKKFASTLFGLIKKAVYCADSFLENFSLVKSMEIDWKKNTANKGGQ